jgi:tRNA(His) 5'-end guanylyltransferase
MIKYNFSEVYCSNDEINLLFRYEDDDKLMDDYVPLITGNAMRIATRLVSEATLNSGELFCGNIFLFEKENSLNNWLKKKQLDCYKNNINIIYEISINSLDENMNSQALEEKLAEYGILDVLQSNDELKNILYGSLSNQFDNKKVK